MTGHRLMGMSLSLTGDAAESLAHFDQAIALYDPAKHRALTARLGSGIEGSVAALLGRAWALWFLGYPEAALRDAESALRVAREIGQAATLMYALGNSIIVQILCGNQDIARARAQEQTAVAEEKGAPFWNAFGLMNQGCCMGPNRNAFKSHRITCRGHCHGSGDAFEKLAPVLFLSLGSRPCGTRAIRGRAKSASTKR